MSAPTAREVLDAVVAHTGGQERVGQQDMTDAVAEALRTRTHLAVEAPTGTGKTFALGAAAVAWLHDGPPDALEDRRVVIATATRSLQDQLVHEDLPTVAAAVADLGVDLRFAVLKGRSNYLCLAKSAEMQGALLEEEREAAHALEEAADDKGTGERSSLPEVRDDRWRLLSATSEECPGATKCSAGEVCWAEKAKRTAERADIVVVNTALYASHLLAGGEVLPAHDVVIVDEAHALADVLVSAASVSVSPARLRNAERVVRAFADEATAKRLIAAADGLTTSLDGLDGLLDVSVGDVAVHLASARSASKDAAKAATDAAAEKNDEALRAASTATNLAEDLSLLCDGDGRDRVAWVERDNVIAGSPVEAGPLGTELLWPGRTVVCTSATLRGADVRGNPTFANFLEAVGAPDGVTTLAVDSPFDPASQGLLYVPKGRIPSPKEPGWEAGVIDEVWGLAAAADGRTLALFTSRAATERVAEALKRRSADAAPGTPGAGLEILTQWDGTRERLVGALRRRRRVVLCATRSFWTGVDIPGDACVVVAIDRIPFPRPDDPLISARRERAVERGQRSFEAVDLPMAAMQLAQGVGRLLRSPTDRGVVAVLDTRLAEARWRTRILGALPPLKRTIDADEVATFLADS